MSRDLSLLSTQSNLSTNTKILLSNFKVALIHTVKRKKSSSISSPFLKKLSTKPCFSQHLKEKKIIKINREIKNERVCLQLQQACFDALASRAYDKQGLFRRC
jgi:hypothetical protein